MSIICPTYRTDKQYDVQLNSSSGTVQFLNGKKYIRFKGSVRQRDEIVEFNCNDYNFYYKFLNKTQTNPKTFRTKLSPITLCNTSRSISLYFNSTSNHIHSAISLSNADRHIPPPHSPLKELKFVCYLLGNYPASGVYMPTFRNTLSSIFIGR